MSVPIKEHEFPRYFNLKGKLLAFISKDKMYKIEPIGSNMNPGVTIDHYITRAMVLKHWPTHQFEEISQQQFRDLLTRLFTGYINKITA